MVSKLTDRVLLVGPPGSGIFPWARSFCETLSPKEVAPFEGDMSYAYRVAGLAGRGENGDTYRVPSALKPPFRAPHHTCSEAGLMGQLQGWKWRPGEVSLAHGGVLVLDEVTEFRLSVVQAVLAAAKLGYVRYGNTTNSLQVPTQFALIVASNPCLCGWYGFDAVRCKCTAEQVERYQKRLEPWRAICREVPPAEWMPFKRSADVEVKL